VSSVFRISDFHTFMSAAQRLGIEIERTLQPLTAPYLTSNTVGCAKLSIMWTLKEAHSTKSTGYSRGMNVSFSFQNIGLCSSVFTHHHTLVMGSSEYFLIAVRYFSRARMGVIPGVALNYWISVSLEPQGPVFGYPVQNRKSKLNFTVCITPAF
jgi:hypothetical protein